MRTDAGDPPFHDFIPRDDFKLLILTPSEAEVPPEIKQHFSVVKVVSPGAGGGGGPSKEDPGAAEDASLAAAMGVKLVERSSEKLVEAAFDGEIEEASYTQSVTGTTPV